MKADVESSLKEKTPWQSQGLRMSSFSKIETNFSMHCRIKVSVLSLSALRMLAYSWLAIFFCDRQIITSLASLMFLTQFT